MVVDEINRCVVEKVKARSDNYAKALEVCTRLKQDAARRPL